MERTAATKVGRFINSASKPSDAAAFGLSEAIADGAGDDAIGAMGAGPP